MNGTPLFYDIDVYTIDYGWQVRLSIGSRKIVCEYACDQIYEIVADDHKEWMVVSTIDRTGKLPLYHQIAMSLEQRIGRQEWKLGDRLPSEHELATSYEVSRMTVRQALTELERDGVVIRKRPTGTFVNRIPDYLAPTVSVMVDIMKSLADAGYEMEITTLHLGTSTEGPREARSFLVMDDQGEFTILRRRITADGRPFAWVQTYMDTSRMPTLVNATLRDNSLQATIQDHYGRKASAAEHWVRVDATETSDMELLGVDQDSLIVNLDSAFIDQDKEPLAYMTTRMIASRLRLHLRSVTPFPLLDTV